MADPLSVAASVAGLITIAGKLGSILYKVGTTYIDFPASLQSARHEMNSSVAVFSQLQELLDTLNQRTHSGQLSMISVNGLLDTLVECVRIFSDLEKLVNDVVGRDEVTFMMRAKWVRNEAAINKVIQELQGLKITLTLMLSIINCRTTTDAERSMRRLETMFQPGTTAMPPVTAHHSYLDDSSSIISVGSTRTVGGTFENILRKTWVYRSNSVRNVSSLSLGSNVTPWTKSTARSDVSLAEISDISGLELPIRPDSLYNQSYYNAVSNSSRQNLDPITDGVPIIAHEDQVHEDQDQEAEDLAHKNTAQQLLVLAAKFGELEMIKISLDRGADVNYAHPLSKRKSALQIAATNGQNDAVKLLLDCNADINFEDESGETALHHAARKKHASTVDLLCENSANMRKRDLNWVLPLSFAAMAGDLEVFRVLLKYTMAIQDSAAVNEAFIYAMKVGQMDVANLLLERGASTNGWISSSNIFRFGISRTGTVVRTAGLISTIGQVRILCHKCSAQMDTTLHYACTVCRLFHLCPACYHRGETCRGRHILVPQRQVITSSRPYLETDRFCSSCEAWVDHHGRGNMGDESLFWHCTESCNKGNWYYCPLCIFRGLCCDHILQLCTNIRTDRHHASAIEEPLLRLEDYVCVMHRSYCNICGKNTTHCGSIKWYHCSRCLIGEGNYDVCNSCNISLGMGGICPGEGGHEMMIVENLGDAPNQLRVFQRPDITPPDYCTGPARTARAVAKNWDKDGSTVLRFPEGAEIRNVRAALGVDGERFLWGVYAGKSGVFPATSVTFEL